MDKQAQIHAREMQRSAFREGKTKLECSTGGAALLIGLQFVFDTVSQTKSVAGMGLSGKVGPLDIWFARTLILQGIARTCQVKRPNLHLGRLRQGT